MRRPRDPECSIQDCPLAVVALGLCRLHYERDKRGAPVDGSRTRTLREERECAVDGCERMQRTRDWCAPHYSRWLRTGDPEGSVPRKPRENGRGAGWINEYGYRMLHRPEHPNARRGNRVPEHVVVMSEILGRGLRPNENVHHRNGQRADNRPENLELWLVPQPAGQRVSDLIEFANWITERYGKDPTAYP